MSASMQHAPEGPSLRQELAWLRPHIWQLAALVIVAAAVATRLWGLGPRSYNHDEAIHAWESWLLYSGRGYVHDPVYHGPFLYHATALVFFLFGDSDYTGRLSAALFSIATVVTVLFLRRWLGRRGALVAAALVVVSPALLYYGRFIRHDVFSVFFTLLMLLGILRYLERREDKYLYLVVIGQALYFCNMETAFIQTFVFWTFLLSLFLWQWCHDRSRRWRQFPALDLLVVMGCLVLPLASPLAIKLVGLNPTDYGPQSLARSGAIWLLSFALSMGIGLWWDRKRWLVAAGWFYAIYVALFTTFFSNGLGLVTGQLGSLGYWLTQQTARRGGQPWYYYLVLLPLYEYLPLVFGLAGAVLYLVRRRLSTGARHEAAPAVSAPFVPLLIWWATLNLLVFSWAGEKMPWLSVHLTLPLILLSGWFAGQLLALGRQDALSWRAGWVAMLAPLAAWGFMGSFSLWPFAQRVAGGPGPLLARVSGVVLLAITGVPLLRTAQRLGWRAAGRAALTALLGLLFLATVHHAWMAVYRNGDVAVEPLIYAQGSPDVPLVIRELEALSRRLSGEKDLKIAHDSDCNWPFVWYLRDWPNAQILANPPDGPLDAAVVMVRTDNEATFKPFLGSRYQRRQYRLVWWPAEDYKGLTPARIWQGLSDPKMRWSLWDILMYRRYETPLTAWPLVHNFALYVRRDVLVRPGESGLEGGSNATVSEDAYVTRYRPLTAQRSWGGPGDEGRRLGEPKGVALDGQGRAYVTDARSHRIQVFDQQGAMVSQWGGPGQGPGQFQEPWGIAVARDGTVYVADTWNHRLQRFDAAGNYLGQWGTYGSTGGRADGPSGVLYGPRGVAVDPEGSVWVTDTGNKRICEFAPDGTLLGQWGSAGTGDGQFLEPVGIAVDGQGRVYVADTWNRRVQLFDHEMHYLRQWPVAGWEGQSATNKPYLAVDNAGNVFVTDPEGHCVIQFNSEGQVLAVWGKRGADLASLNLPTGIVVDEQGRVLVADSGNQRVLEFAPVRQGAQLPGA